MTQRRHPKGDATGGLDLSRPSRICLPVPQGVDWLPSMIFPPPPKTDRAILRTILDTAKVLGSEGVAIFDLDSTLIDNRPRQAQIFREIGEALDLPALASSSLAHWDSSWDVKGAMVRAGLEEERADRAMPDVLRLWEQRFFTDEYCAFDTATPGARAFLERIQGAGARIVYCTGRPALMRQGTIESFERFSFPVPDGEAVILEMKPQPSYLDDEYKRVIQSRLGALGTVFAAFDNEPTHINGYRLAYPGAHVVHLATDHSGRDVAVAAGIPAIVDFVLPG